eukprot:CAMPEP_0113646820 /NCGR_PEP_ID=MMETSP0017_2-20120614/24751_1 /TAXON_ID=2856 /ORGANISM="Cylindrotheca closterium" /LENGTH=48 /DNA_ID=CAMNT_0000558775 /DNA_START=253 /DNA_END=396 /DNA_ORIENTATION=- /assembly_acc=CAM_ASM_000147
MAVIANISALSDQEESHLPSAEWRIDSSRSVVAQKPPSSLGMQLLSLT